MIFMLETELELRRLEKLCRISDNVRVTYDTGNTTSFGIDHKDYIDLLFEKIENVHLKDRTLDGRSVIPASGDTDFRKIFSLLKKRGYDKFYTIQTTRELPGDEQNTIGRHIDIFRKLYDE
jgi:sugar phosphate isomerase/epimerase